MFQRFRQAKVDVATMRRLFTQSEQLARAAGRGEPGVDDLVMAALTLPDGTARAALAEFGVGETTLRTALEAARGAPPPAPLDGEPSRTYRSEPSMQMAFHRAVGNAKADRSHVRSGDLLLAALDDDAGVVSRAVTALGIEREELAVATRARLAG